MSEGESGTESCSNAEHELKLFYDKQGHYYAACVNAFYNTSFEHDRSILTLSTAGIAFITGLISTKGVANTYALVISLLAIIFFTCSLIFVLAIFKVNRNYITEIIQDKNPSPSLGILDNLALGCFGLGIIFTVIMGIAFSIDAYQEGNKMSERKNVFANDSAIGAHALKPSNIVEKSVTGAVALKPQAPASAPIIPASQNSESKK
jgi:hypothetical protein